jgi:hypothetical protein
MNSTLVGIFTDKWLVNEDGRVVAGLIESSFGGVTLGVGLGLREACSLIIIPM